MNYLVNNGIWSNVFAVPTEIVDKHIKLVGVTALKVLLILLRNGSPVDSAQLAERLNLPEEDIQDAMNCWISLGVVLPDRGEPAPPALSYQKMPDPPARKKRPQAEEGERTVRRISSERQRLSTQEINEMAQSDENIAYLLQETQSVLGKPLTPVATDTVTALYSYYGMKPDLILMLIQYCVSIGKDNMRYIEKVASSWLENGIDTHERAEREILRSSQKNQNESKIKSAFGIYDRSLVPSERAYMETWLEEYKMSIPLIQFAYERSVEMKGKLSFAYINGILTNWHQKGITTPAQAAKEIRGEKRKQPAQKPGEASYDMEELENMVNYGTILK